MESLRRERFDWLTLPKHSTTPLHCIWTVTTCWTAAPTEQPSFISSKTSTKTDAAAGLVKEQIRDTDTEGSEEPFTAFVPSSHVKFQQAGCSPSSCWHPPNFLRPCGLIGHLPLTEAQSHPVVGTNLSNQEIRWFKKSFTCFLNRCLWNIRGKVAWNIKLVSCFPDH